MTNKQVTYGKLIGTEIGRGRAALFLHGGLLNRSIFFDLMAVLQRDRRCIAIDLPGFGASPSLGTSKLSLTNLADAVIPTLKELSAQGPVDVVGLSLGGGVVVEMAHSASECIRTVSLIGVGGRGRTSKPSSSRDQKKFTVNDLDDFALQFAERMLPSPANEKLRQSVIAAVKSTPHETTSALIKLLGHYPDVVGRAQDLKIPIMALCGENDTMVSYDHLRRAFNGAKNVIVRIVEEAGHLVPIEAPEILANDLRAFWASTAN